jgi:hypothetical protein
MPKHMLVMLVGALLLWLSACTVANESQPSTLQLLGDDYLVWEAPLAATVTVVETVARSNKPYFEFPVTIRGFDNPKGILYSVDFVLERYTNPVDSNKYSISVFIFGQPDYVSASGKITINFGDFIGDNQAPAALVQAFAQLRQSIIASMDATYKRAKL